MQKASQSFAMASRGKYAPLNADSENGNKSKYVSDLDESREAEPRRGFLHGRRRYYLAGFAAILVISVVTLAAVFGTNSGNLLPSHLLCRCSFIYQSESH